MLNWWFKYLLGFLPVAILHVSFLLCCWAGNFRTRRNNIRFQENNRIHIIGFIDYFYSAFLDLYFAYWMFSDNALVLVISKGSELFHRYTIGLGRSLQALRERSSFPCRQWSPCSTGRNTGLTIHGPSILFYPICQVLVASTLKSLRQGSCPIFLM